MNKWVSEGKGVGGGGGGGAREGGMSGWDEGGRGSMSWLH